MRPARSFEVNVAKDKTKYISPPDRESAPALPGQAELSEGVACKALWIGMRPKGDFDCKDLTKKFGLQTIRDTDDVYRIVVMLQRKEGTAAQLKVYH